MIYADNVGYVRNAAGGPNGGHWHIDVEAAGEYEFTLRRWPEQTRVALGDPYDDKQAGPEGTSKAFPTIAQAMLEIAGAQQSVAGSIHGQRELRCQSSFPPGRTTLKAWFEDESGKDLCGAFFVTVKLKGK